MKGSRITALAALTALVVASAAAATTANAASEGVETTAEAATATLQIQYAVKRFVVRDRRLIAVGNVIGTYATAEGTEVVRQPFAVRVRRISASRQLQQNTRICDILSLNLAPLRLELLGLIVELDRVVLTIKADSEGGLLGGLLCGLAGSSTPLANPLTAARLTRVAAKSGLSAGPGFQVPLVVPTVPGGGGMASQSPQDLPPVPPGVCTVLDLVIGPLDLNLLGLMVHLDRVQLRITADPTKGLLGSLLCSLAGGIPAPTP